MLSLAPFLNMTSSQECINVFIIGIRQCMPQLYLGIYTKDYLCAPGTKMLVLRLHICFHNCNKSGLFTLCYL